MADIPHGRSLNIRTLLVIDFIIGNVQATQWPYHCSVSFRKLLSMMVSAGVILQWSLYASSADFGKSHNHILAGSGQLSDIAVFLFLSIFNH